MTGERNLGNGIRLVCEVYLEGGKAGYGDEEAAWI
jgi:hypothetical protein